MVTINHSVVKVACTVANLEGRVDPSSPHPPILLDHSADYPAILYLLLSIVTTFLPPVWVLKYGQIKRKEKFDNLNSIVEKNNVDYHKNKY